MKHYHKYFYLLLSLCVYFFLWKMMNPILGYNLDSDSVAYLSIAKRVADGDFFKSINGLWSPLNSWILASFIQKGYDAWQAAKLLNMLFGSVLLIQSFFFFRLLKVREFMAIILQFVLSVVMVYMVFFQVFGDVLQMIFVLAYLQILFQNKPLNFLKMILSGLIMGVAFYAKAYSFFFLVIHLFTVMFYFVSQKKIDIQKALKLYSVAILTMLLVILPWSFQLQKKYGEFSLTGFAGKLNMSWYINSGKSFKSDIQLLIPPTESDSPSFWVDPYPTQQNLSTPTSSPQHFLKWVARVIHTTIACVFCFEEISFVSLAVLLISIFYFFFYQKNENENFAARILIITICLLPLGYLMMHIETRYIWLNIILIMTLGALMLQEFRSKIQPVMIYYLACVLLAISFMIYPIFSFWSLKYKNKKLFEVASVLNEKNIHGRFTSNIQDAGQMWVIAYLTGSQFYTIEKQNYSERELIDEMKKFEVKYLFFQTENNILKCNFENFQLLMNVGDLKILELKSQ